MSVFCRRPNGLGSCTASLAQVGEPASRSNNRQSEIMKKIEAIIRHHKLDDIKEALIKLKPLTHSSNMYQRSRSKWWSPTQV